MSALVFAPFVVGGLTGLVFELLSYRHLSERGLHDPWRPLREGGLLGRDHFNARGRRYHALAGAAIAAGAVTSAALAFLGTAYGWW